MSLEVILWQEEDLLSAHTAVPQAQQQKECEKPKQRVPVKSGTVNPAGENLHQRTRNHPNNEHNTVCL